MQFVSGPRGLQTLVRTWCDPCPHVTFVWDATTYSEIWHGLPGTSLWCWWVPIGEYYLSVYFRSLSLPDTHIQTSGDRPLHVFIQESGCPHTAVWMSSSGRPLGLLKIFSISVTLSVSDCNTRDQMGCSGLNTCEIPAEIIFYVCIMCYEEARKKTIEEITLYFQSSL